MNTVVVYLEGQGWLLPVHRRLLLVRVQSAKCTHRFLAVVALRIALGVTSQVGPLVAGHDAELCARKDFLGGEAYTKSIEPKKQKKKLSLVGQIDGWFRPLMMEKSEVPTLCAY